MYVSNNERDCAKKEQQYRSNLVPGLHPHLAAMVWCMGLGNRRAAWYGIRGEVGLALPLGQLW